MTTMWARRSTKALAGFAAARSEAGPVSHDGVVEAVIANRATRPWYLVRYWRLLKFKLTNPHIITRGMVFLGKNVEDPRHA